MPHYNHTTASSRTPAAFFRADRALLAAACAAICGWAVSLAWLWMA
ncbi:MULTISPECIES: hypothetical protein [Pseudomonas]|nr:MULTISPECIES: hypothetical protein [Pseudomonas]MBA1242132.1 hypothetical protein [Pseudomonas japonica]MBA1288444.1 hypothetical protein [Pseudomonas japonica]